MKTLDEYLQLAAVAHGHLCAGQVLGVRLAMLGLRELGITDPIAERKRIVTYVEIDRCMTDAIALVANCRLGKRALKFRDWGKVAATFVDLQTGRAIRIAAKESSKQIAREMFPEMTKDAGQQKAYAAALRRRSLRQKMGKGRSQTRKTCPATKDRAWSAPNAAKASISNAKCCKADALCVAAAPAKAITPDHARCNCAAPRRRSVKFFGPRPALSFVIFAKGSRSNRIDAASAAPRNVHRDANHNQNRRERECPVPNDTIQTQRNRG